jgi:hypothetical protein
MEKNKKPSLVDLIRSKLIDTSLGKLKPEAEDEHSNGGGEDEQ